MALLIHVFNKIKIANKCCFVVYSTCFRSCLLVFTIDQRNAMETFRRDII